MFDNIVNSSRVYEAVAFFYSHLQFRRQFLRHPPAILAVGFGPRQPVGWQAKGFAMQPPPLIAIADDNEYLVELVEASFSAKRWRTLRIPDGAAVVRKIAAERVSALVLDIELPGRSGLEVPRDVKADTRFASIPVIMLTGRRLPSDVETAKALGAVGYVVKPFNLNALTRRVERCLYIDPPSADVTPQLDVD